MDLGPDQRRLANDIFVRALLVLPDERTVFVERETQDPLIRQEALSLLDWHDRTDQFIPPVMTLGMVGPPQQSDQVLPVGHQVGQYRISGVLGEGGMGVVYRADDQRLGRVVALKAISSSVARDPIRRERLRREARAAASLTHPGIATVYALEEIGDDLFIAGEFVAGETLRAELARGPVDAGRVLDTAAELAQALGAAHDRGIVHRDLKPENVIRTPSGRVKILDFGLARMRDVSPELANLTDDGKVFGTPGYMSPEQIRRETLDARSDLFSLGIVLYELLTGTHPFGGSDSASTVARILEAEPAPIDTVSQPGRTSDSLTRRVEGVIRTLLQKSPMARFASAHELLKAIDRVRAGQTLPRNAGPTDAMWWWKFHQAATSVFYGLLMIPAWFARQALDASAAHRPYAQPLFLLAMVAMVAATTIRLHLWFAADSMPGEWDHQHARNWKWLRAADLALVAALTVSGIAVLNLPGASANGVVLVILAVVALLSATIIEPATTRAAFGPQSRSARAD